MIKHVTFLFLFFGAATLFSQRVHIGLSSGYQFGGAVDESHKDQGIDIVNDALGIKGSLFWGVYLSYGITPKVRGELSFDRQPTYMNYHHADGAVEKWQDMTVDYYLVGLLYDWSKTRVQPFAGFALGMSEFSLKGNYEPERQLVAAPIVGVRLVANQHFAFRLHTRVLLSDMPAGVFFRNSDTGEGFKHHKSTFLTQIQLAAGFFILL